MSEEKKLFQEGKPLKASSRPLTGMRKAISQKMCESYFQNPVVTLTTEIDMTEAAGFRKKWNGEQEEEGCKLSFLDMIIAAVAHALHNHPSFNARLEEQKIYFLDEVHVGFAVDLNGRGLVVPVIRDADGRNLAELAEERARLVEKVLSGRGEPGDFSGGTFTVTNLGSYGIDAFTPIINAPECGILGVGRIVKKPVAVEDEVVIRSRMVLSLTHDHRLNDGGPAAKFLREIGDRLEHPEWMKKDCIKI